jgi:hypothetical protein
MKRASLTPKYHKLALMFKDIVAMWALSQELERSLDQLRTLAENLLEILHVIAVHEVVLGFM